MYEYLQAIWEILDYRIGRHDTPVWMYFVYPIIAYIGFIKAKEIITKRKALREAKKEKLSERDLKATLYSEEHDGTVEYNGTISSIDSNYHLHIVEKKNGGSIVVVDTKKNTLDEVADYLRRETKFILADFKQ